MVKNVKDTDPLVSQIKTVCLQAYLENQNSNLYLALKYGPDVSLP